MLYVSLFPRNEIYLGLRISQVSKVSNLSSYNPEKEYPSHYVVELGFIFVTFTWRSS